MVCFLLLLAAVIRADYLDGDDGIDRPYGDLAGMPLILASGAQPRDCATLCQQRSDCSAWAYVKSDPPPCYLKAQVMPQTMNSARVSGTKDVKLLIPMYKPLNVLALKPSGWLTNQLKIQATGLSGYLSKFWADVENSSWIGGDADTGLHERTPYWMNGIVPLAFQLMDPDLLSQSYYYVNYVLTHQDASGWMGPDDVTDGDQYWSKFPIMMALTQYAEANSTDTRVIPAIYKLLQNIRTRMFSVPFGDSWSGARWQDLVLTLQWLYDNAPNGQEQFLWDLADLAHEQGFDWKEWFDGPEFPTGAVNDATLWTHGVNNGQAIKSEAVWYRQSKDITDVDSSYIRMQKIDQYHGQASGIFSCDEHLAGLMPSRGSELCTVVETMFSYSILFSVIGDVQFADKIEELAFNALPATFTSDMWAHQYLQQCNNVQDTVQDDHVWQFDGPDSNLYGLEPNYGCCTANFNQGWPKFMSRMVYVSSKDNGIAIALYGPLSVDLSSIAGPGAVLTVATNYPFDNVINIKVSGIGSSLPVSIRIPSWADPATTTLTINGGAAVSPPVGTMYTFSCPAGGCSAVLTLGMKIRLETRYNGAISIHRGTLLYGITMGETFTTLATYAYNSKDYAVTNNTAWNYGIQISNLNAPEQSLTYVQGAMTSTPFSLTSSPVKITAKGRLIPGWGLEHNAAAPPPQSPVSSTQPLVDITLLPFGATELRIGEIPLLAN